MDSKTGIWLLGSGKEVFKKLLGEIIMNLKDELFRCSDQRKEWLQVLKARFELSDEEAKKLDRRLRACFALNLDMLKVKSVILHFLTALGRQVTDEDLDVDGVFTTRAGKRRYKQWSWQENLFCIMAYLLAVFFFVIDLFDFGCNSLLQVAHQAGAAMLVMMLFLLIDRCWRGNSKVDIWFSVANTFMPSVTMIAYCLFYVFKLLFISSGNFGWHIAMIFVIAVYTMAGILGTFAKYRYYTKLLTTEISMLNENTLS